MRKLWMLLVAAWWWSLVGIQRTAQVLYVFSSLGLFIFLSWFLIAAGVDLVSDAQVYYATPLVGTGLSLVMFFLCWIAVEGIKGMAESYRARHELNS